MLETIKEYFQIIVDGFNSVIDFVIGLVQDLIYIIKLTGAFVAKLPDLFSWLPAEALVLVLSIFAVVVIYKILGREG